MIAVDFLDSKPSGQQNRDQLKSVILKFNIHQSHVESLLKTQTAGPHTQSFKISRPGGGAWALSFYQV